jgi:hypothetical protein
MQSQEEAEARVVKVAQLEKALAEAEAKLVYAEAALAEALTDAAVAEDRRAATAAALEVATGQLNEQVLSPLTRTDTA